MLPDDPELTDLLLQLGAGGDGSLSTASILMTAILSSFLVVRLLKGSWTRDPAALVVAMVGGTVVALVAKNLQVEWLADPLVTRIAGVVRCGATYRAFTAEFRPTVAGWWLTHLGVL